jgi:hypothetical protein
MTKSQYIFWMFCAIYEPAHFFASLNTPTPNRSLEIDTDFQRNLQDEFIFIPQHPQGYSRQIAVHINKYWDYETLGDINCRVDGNVSACFAGNGYDDIGYECDTDGGSSGSPVISRETYKVIALHHVSIFSVTVK